ncbi:MAG: hypothetical protein JW795_18745 [Chitinivibrionales bacterium]|nr:hypothetical protein [Chitinivibrionales bacterium]
MLFLSPFNCCNSCEAAVLLCDAMVRVIRQGVCCHGAMMGNASMMIMGIHNHTSCLDKYKIADRMSAEDDVIDKKYDSH